MDDNKNGKVNFEEMVKILGTQNEYNKDLSEFFFKQADLNNDK